MFRDPFREPRGSSWDPFWEPFRDACRPFCCSFPDKVPSCIGARRELYRKNTVNALGCFIICLRFVLLGKSRFFMVYYYVKVAN